MVRMPSVNAPKQAFDLVGRNAHAQTGAAQQDAAVIGAVGHAARHLKGGVCIDGVVTAQIDHIIA